MSQDALNQFCSLVHRIDRRLPPPPDAAVYAPQISAMHDEDAWTCLRQLQLWLAAFPPEDSANFLIRLTDLCGLFRAQAPPTLVNIYKAVALAEGGVGVAPRGARAPSVSIQRNTLGGGGAMLDEEDDDLEGGDRFDCAGWLEKASDELVGGAGEEDMELFLYKTAALVLRGMREVGGLDHVPLEAVYFFTTSVECGSTLYVQRCAALCVGILSVTHLRPILDVFFEKQRVIPEKRFRWLLYTQATQLYAFGFDNQEQAEATVAFFDATARKMAKIDRGKLRGSICSSLHVIIGRMMGAAAADGEASAAAASSHERWRDFTQRFALLAGQYGDAYVSIFHTVAKWAKKAKHALPCWRLMVSGAAR